MPSETIQQLLRERATSDAIAVKYGDRQLDLARAPARRGRRAAALLALADPDRPLHVGVLLGNTPELLRSMAAAGLGGYVLCGLNTTRRGDALAADVRRADCQVLVTDAEHLPLLDGLDLPGVRVLDGSGDEWARLAANPPGQLSPYREVGAMDTFMLIFTSGTSGDPKAVQVSHFMVLMSGANLVAAVLRHRRRHLLPRRCRCSTPTRWWRAGRWPSRPARRWRRREFSASRFLDDIRRYGATYMNYVGKPLAYVLATPERARRRRQPAAGRVRQRGQRPGHRGVRRRFDCESGTASAPPRTPSSSPGSPAPRTARSARAFRASRSTTPDTVTECPVAEFDERRRADQRRRGGRRAGQHRGRRLLPGLLQRPRPRTPSGCGTACTGRATSPTATPTAGSTWPAAPPTGCASTARTSRRPRSSGSCAAARQSTGSPSTPCPTRTSATRSWPRSCSSDDATLTPGESRVIPGRAARPVAEGWPRYVRIAADLPTTATNKVLKRELIAQGADSPATASCGCVNRAAPDMSAPRHKRFRRDWSR